MKLVPGLLAIVLDRKSNYDYVATITNIQVGREVTVQLGGVNWVPLDMIAATRYRAGLEERPMWVTRHGFTLHQYVPGMEKNTVLQAEYAAYLTDVTDQDEKVLTFESWVIQ